jgi:hypothetical protein
MVAASRVPKYPLFYFEDCCVACFTDFTLNELASSNSLWVDRCEVSLASQLSGESYVLRVAQAPYSSIRASERLPARCQTLPSITPENE